MTEKTFKTYYEDEISFLRQMGPEFASAHPASSRFLAERGSDPDVERLLEGFAFIAGRLRQKLDDEVPELTQSLMQLISPHFLRPVPAMTILEFKPVAHIVKEPQLIPRGTEVESEPVEDAACVFRTSYDVEILPAALESAVMEEGGGERSLLRLSLRMNPDVPGSALGTDRLRFYLHGDATTRFALFLNLTRRLERITVETEEGQSALPSNAVRPVGFADTEALLPYPPHAFPAYRHLQEYFTLPEKYLFLDIMELPSLAGVPAGGRFQVVCRFTERAEAVPRFSRDNVRLHCTPVVNLFPLESAPLKMNHEKSEYLLRPEGRRDHLEIFSVDGVRGYRRGTAEEREYPSFYSFRQAPPEEEGGTPSSGTCLYVTRLRSSPVDQGMDTYISFVDADQGPALPPTETVLADLTCTNRELPKHLRVGDVNRPRASSPVFAGFTNITPVTPSMNPPLGGELYWRLISNLYLNQNGLASAEALRGTLEVYNFRALHDRKAARESQLLLESISSVRPLAEERPYRGAIVRGTRVEIEMKEDHFAGEGEMVLFASVLNEFLALHCSLNSFIRLVVRGAEQKEVYTWEPRIGIQTLI